MVLRALDGPVEDVVPAERAITVRDLLTFQAGHGFPANFDVPVVQLLMERLGQGPPQPQMVPAPDEWMARLGEIPLLHQPGQGWTYNTGSDILGVLLARAAGTTLGELLAEAIFEPLGMGDTAFWAEDAARMTSFYRRQEGGFELVDAPDGQWSSAPAFESGAGGLVSTADDWCAFGQMLLGGGEYRGRRVLSPESVAMMMTSHGGGAGQPVPRRPGLGVRRRGRRTTDRSVERPRALRLGRWHRDRRLRDPVDRHGRGLAQPGRDGRPGGHVCDGRGAHVRGTVRQLSTGSSGLRCRSESLDVSCHPCRDPTALLPPVPSDSPASRASPT